MLLGLTKIYSKKTILLLDELDQSLQQLIQGFSSSSEVLKEIGIADIPDKLKLIPIQKPELFNPLSKLPKILSEKPKKDLNSVNLYEISNNNEEIDDLGVTTSFLDDVEMAEQWLRKDEDITLPAKRPREKV